MSAMGEIKALGAYGTKVDGKGTTAFWLNDAHVIDAGNLLTGMHDKVADIEGIWLTHSHLDHLLDIAFIMSGYFTDRKTPLRIMGLPETLDAVKEHFLNDKIWPDFSEIKMADSDMMSVEYVAIEFGKVYDIGKGMSVEPIEADHIVPCCGYKVRDAERSVVISSDTYSLDAVIEKIDTDESVTAAVVECSFPSKMETIAQVSKHLTPKILFEQLEAVKKKNIKLYINHIKPTYETQIRAEIEAMKGSWNCIILQDGDEIPF